MKIPFKPSRLKVRHKSPKWIILHHTSELYKQPDVSVDNPKFQLTGIMNGVLELKQADVNYHFVIERIKEDYHAITMRPLVYICEWDDIDTNINNLAVHIALLGNYDFMIPERRCYEVLAYKLLNPMLKMFQLNMQRIKFHRDLSSNKDLTCPGDFVDPVVIEAMVRRFVIK